MIAVDYETTYSTKVSVKPLGYYAYTHHPEFDAYMVSISGEGVEFVGRPDDAPWAEIAGKDWVSHNAQFDRAVHHSLRESGRVPDEGPMTWTCSAAMAAYVSAPRSLEGASEVILKKKADKTQREAMKGRKAEDLANDPATLAYALEDARLSRELHTVLDPYVPDTEKDLIRQTIEIGERGIAVDTDVIDQGIARLENLADQIADSLPWTPDYKPSSPRGLAATCEEMGVPIPATTCAKEDAFLAWADRHGEAAVHVRKIQRWRSVNRLRRVLESARVRTRPDGRLEYGLKYFGAAPGRWSGDAGLNLQNLNSSEFEGVDLRSAFVAPAGKKLVVCDLSQIEPRVLAWLALDSETLRLVKTGMSIYEAHARSTMGWTGGELKTADPKLYKAAKARVLGLGYGCGAEKFITVARNLAGLEISPSEAETTVADYRRTNPLVTRLWRRLDDQFAGDRRDLKDRTLVDLPSGRSLRYFHRYDVPYIENAAEPIKNGRPVSWWGGKLCLGPDTEVMTDSGWKRLVDVTLSDRVFDGVDWVDHEGVVDKGVKETGVFNGVVMTPDHPVLTSTGWIQAQHADFTDAKTQFHRLNRGTVRDTDCRGTGSSLRDNLPQGRVALSMSVWKGNHPTGPGTSPFTVEEDGDPMFPVLPSGRTQERDPRDVEPPGLRRVVLDEGPVLPQEPPGISQLRGSRDLRLSRVGRLLRGVLAGHGADVFSGPGTRPDRQRLGLLARELSVDYVSEEQLEPTLEQVRRNPLGPTHGSGGRTQGRNKPDHPSLPDQPRMAEGGLVKARVFDLLNAGPRHRFTVRGDDGRPFIVHNCENLIQATARDFFAEKLLDLEKAGFVIVLHVHDEAVLEVDADNATDALAEVERIMATPSPWMPADLPLAAEGFITDRYTK